jgi:hypothetical protein
MAASKSKGKNEAQGFSATLTSPDGGDFLITSPVEYYNLKAQGYADKDPGAAAKAVESVESAAVAQTYGPAEGATARTGGGTSK